MLINITYQHSLYCSQTWFLTLVFKNSYSNIRSKYKCYATLSAIFCFVQKQLSPIFEFTIALYKLKYINQNSIIYALSWISIITILHLRSYMILMLSMACILIWWLLYVNTMDVLWYVYLEEQYVNTKRHYI